MPVPDPTTFTETVLDAYSPWVNEDSTNYLTALASIFEQAWSLVVDQGDPDTSSFIPGWSVLLDPNNCPTDYLPYLAQFNGTVVPVGTPDATARAIIVGESGMQRGTPSAIISAAQRNLSGSQVVTLLERTAANGGADGYYFLLIVNPSQVISASALTAAVNAIKPGGVMWELVEAAGYIWSAAIHTWAVDTMTWQDTANTQP